MKRSAWPLVLSRVGICLALMVAAPVALAQTSTGTVTGTVLDSSRAAIPGAQVTLTSRDTNISRQSQSSAVGIYYFGNIPPGPYQLVVEARGFKKWSGTLVLQVGQTAVIDPAMQVGSVETVVSVEDAAPIVTTAGMEVADVKDAMRIRQLPLNGRAITSLFDLTPGVEGGGSPRVNGLKVGSVEMLLDGISLVDRFGGGMSRTQPGLDTIQEFRIETTGSSARYSRPATVILATKSGTNALHGSLFETLRNNAAGLRARQRQDFGQAAKLIRNEFGASAGGPVLLPRLYNGRDKTFWFFSYEGRRERSDNFARAAVPTEAMWEGDFNQIIDNNGRQTYIYDPLTTAANGTRTQFPGNIIPRPRLHPFYATMKSITHLPTDSTNPYQDTNMAEFYGNRTNEDKLTAKGDHRFSDKDSLSIRFSQSHLLNSLLGGRFGAPKADISNGFGTGRTDAMIYSTTLNYNHVFSPRLLNELLLANHTSPKDSGTLADLTAWANQLGLPNPFGLTGWPTISHSDPLDDWDADNRKGENLTAHLLEDNVTWVKGKHSVKFGGKLRFEYNNIRELQQAQGSHTFGSAWTALYDPTSDTARTFTGSGIASMALGLPTFLSNQFNRGYFYFRQKEMGLYFHDSWKISSRLTLDLGVRWDKWTAYKEKYDRLVNVDLATFANKFEVITPKNVRMEDLPFVPPSTLASWALRGLTWKTAREAGFPDNLVPGDNNNFGPRIGAAFKLTDKWVLRAGYGEYFWTMPLSQILQTSRTNPPLNLRYTNQIGSLDGTSTFAVRTAPRPEFFIGRAQVDTEGIITLPPGAQSMMPWDVRDWKDNRAQSWHFTVERELMRNTALRLTYVGDHGRNLEQRYSLNQRESEYNFVARTGQNPPGNRDLMRVNKDWGFRAANHTGFSNTHSLQAEVERRYSNGLAFQWFYVFTRSLTTSDSGGFTSGNGNINSTNAEFEVPENIQLFGAPNLTYDQRLRLGYQNSSNIPAHRIRWNGIYDLPFGRGQRFGGNVPGALNHVIGGWQIASIGDWRGGNWLSVGSGAWLFGDPTLDADERLLLTFNNRSQRLWFRGDFDPSRATNVSQEALQRLVAPNSQRADRVLHPLGANFDNRLPQTLANGTVRMTPVGDLVNWNSRAFFRGPGAWNADVAFFKNFRITETVKARFSADFFNFFNHPNDGSPNATTGLQDLSTQPNQPRIIQFSLRVEW